MPASLAFVADSNRLQPLWQPPPTACLTASGASSEVPLLVMHPWAMSRGRGAGRGGTRAAGSSRAAPAPRGSVLLRWCRQSVCRLFVTCVPLARFGVRGRSSSRMFVSFARVRKRAAFFDSWGVLKFPASHGRAPKFEVCRGFPLTKFPCRHCPQTNTPRPLCTSTEGTTCNFAWLTLIRLPPPPQGCVRTADNHQRRVPPETKVTIVGKTKFTLGKIWLGHFWYTKLWVPDPPPPPPF